MADLDGVADQRTPVTVAEGALRRHRRHVIIDGRGWRPHRRCGSIVVNAGAHHVSIGPQRRATAIPRGVAQWSNARGTTIIPGLWDMHGHASQIEWAPAYLAAGVTTVRDMGAEQAVHHRLSVTAVATRQGPGPAPVAGRPGRWRRRGRLRRDHRRNPARGPCHRRSISRGAIRADQAVQLAASRKLLSAIVSRAHELGMTVTGHVPTALGITGKRLRPGWITIAHMPINGDPVDVLSVARADRRSSPSAARR